MLESKPIFYLARKFNFIKYFFLSILNQNRKVVANKEVLVISTGGIQTTMLMEYLEKKFTINDKNNLDGIKHLYQVPVTQNTKIIYIYSRNYNNIIFDLKKRGLYLNNCLWLKSYLAILFFWIPKISEFFFIQSIDRQIINFLSDRRVLCIEYENIWMDKEKIQNFLKLKHCSDFIKNFPNPKKHLIKHFFITDYLSNRGGYKASRNNIFFFNSSNNLSKTIDLNYVLKSKYNIIKYFFYKCINFIIRKIFYTIKNYDNGFTLPQFFNLLEIKNNENYFYHIHYANLLFNYDYIRKNPKSNFVIYIYDEWWLNSVFHFNYKNLFFWDNIIKENKKRILMLENVRVICSTDYIYKQVKKFKKKNISKQLYYINPKQWRHKNRKLSRQKLFLDQKVYYILFIARAGTENIRKGGEYLKKIAKKFVKFKSIKFLVLGQYDLNKVKNKASRNIELIDVNNDDDLVDLYSSVDLNLTLSGKENLPYSILESLSCGVPNISFNVGGCNEIIKNNYNGFLVKKNFSDIKKNINKILKNKKFKKNSRTSIKKIKFNHILKLLNF